jgi:putative transcriptional regulator
MPATRREVLALLAALAWPEPPGRILVATPALTDADFARSVILLFTSDAQAAQGLMLNRPLPGRPGEPAAYAGGPVAQGLRSLTRQASTPEARRLCAGVYLVAGQSSDQGARLYVGYTGWSGAQLADEVARGLWRIIPGSAAVAFDADPKTLWRRLNS